MSAPRTAYVRQRGETITIQRADSLAADGGEANVTGKLKPYPAGKWAIAAGTAAVATATTTFRAATAEVDKGWDFTISASDSAGLDPGFYQFDYVTVNGAVKTVSDPCAVQIVEASSL